MPIPTPSKDEQLKAFVNRCMGDPVMLKEFEGNSQRYAVCMNKWEKAHEKQNSSAFEIDVTQKATEAKAALLNAVQMQQQFRIFSSQLQRMYPRSYSKGSLSTLFSSLDNELDAYIDTHISASGRGFVEDLDLSLFKSVGSVKQLEIIDSCIALISENDSLFSLRSKALADLSDIKAYLKSLR